MITKMADHYRLPGQKFKNFEFRSVSAYKGNLIPIAIEDHLSVANFVKK